MPRDYYEILNVSPDATQEEIHRAYRRLAREYHPDVSKDPQAEEKFKEINEAYQVLGDPQRRAEYDRQRRGGLERMPLDFGSPFEDLFEAFFGEMRAGAEGGPGRQGPSGEQTCGTTWRSPSRRRPTGRNAPSRCGAGRRAPAASGPGRSGAGDG